MLAILGFRIYNKKDEYTCYANERSRDVVCTFVRDRYSAVQGGHRPRLMRLTRAYMERYCSQSMLYIIHGHSKYLQIKTLFLYAITTTLLSITYREVFFFM